MDKLGKVLFHTVLIGFIVMVSAVLAGFIIMACVKLAHYIDKLF